MVYNKLFITKDLPDLLSKDEFLGYFEEYKNGSLDARNRIVEHNIRLVYSVVGSFQYVPCEYEELISIGLEALIKSVDSFDINRGFEFSTYSIKVISNEINLFLRKNRKHFYTQSLEELIEFENDGSGGVSLLGLIASDNFCYVDDYEKRESYRIIRELVDNFPDREKQAIMMYYGFYENQVYSQEQIAEYLGISQKTVSRILIKTVNQIQDRLIEIGIIAYKHKEKATKRKWLVR